MSELTPDRLRARATLTTGTLAISFLLLAAFFFRAQVLNYQDYRLQSEKNRLRQVPLAAPRGAILDRNGIAIADNVPGYTVKLFAPSVDSMRAVLVRLQAVVALDSGDLETIVRRFRAAQYQPAVVLSGAALQTVSKLEEHRYLLPGLVIQTEPRRTYPAGSAVAQLAGYVGEVSEDELGRDRYPGARMGSVVGRDGLEQEYDSLLRGVDGVRYTEVDARGRMVREEVSSPSLAPIAGNLIKTTIDLPLQQFVDSMWQSGLPGKRGALVAMTPNGEILTLYSAPNFNPNEFIGRIPASRWNAYNGDPALPLLNRAIRGTYPPASTFKLATAVMALRKGVVGFDTHMPIPCRGGMQFGNRFIHCWKKEGHGSLDLTGAIAASCDVYFYQLGLKLGLTDMLEDGTRLGFGERSGIDLESEQRPIYPPNTQYYDRRYGPRGWTNAVTLNLAIGQGENAQSLMNMVRFYAALAGDGTAGPPYLVRPREVPRRSLGLSAEQLAGIRVALAKVVSGGTAAASKGRDLDVAGKTGTAQGSHGQDHGWFIGFAPVDHPRVVVGAIMEDLGGHGGAFVAPWVVQVIRRYLVEQDSSLAHARVRVPILNDTVPKPLPGADRYDSMRRAGLDRSLLIVVVLLAAFGVLMVYSAGQTDVPSVARGAWLRQLVWLGIGLTAGATIFRVNFRILEWAAPGIYLLALALLGLTLVIGTGAGSAASSKSWLAIGGHRIGQPVELAKLATILLLARYLSSLREAPRTLPQLFKPCVLVGAPFLLVMAQPDLGSAIVFVGILFAMLFWAGVAPRLLLMLASPAVSLLLAADTRWWGAWMLVLLGLLLFWRAWVVEGVLVYLVNSAMGVIAILVWGKLKPYQQKRLITFMNPESDPIHAGYQAIQSKVAIGSGGLFGNGFLNGPQKRLAFLPEQYTDFIFSVVGEELGFAGVVVALGLFLWLFLVLLRIARRATDPFSSLVVFGLLGLFFTHLFENVGMTINVMPITGIPLPFFSYGGSFLLTSSLHAIGLSLRVAWDSRLSGYADI